MLFKLFSIKAPFLIVTLVFSFFVTGCNGHSSRDDIDKINPEITLIGEPTVEITAGQEYSDLGATATDNIDGDIEVQTSGTVDTSKEGEYTLTYSAIDSFGNTARVTRTVIVKLADITQPEITILGLTPIDVELGTDYVDAGATATDDVDGDITVTSESTVDTTKIGDYTITYTAVDSSGNTATAARLVIVKIFDRTKPVITINGKLDTVLELGAAYVDAGATAKDDVDDDISVTSVSTVDTSKVGKYTVTYHAIDKAGNESQAIRMVRVKQPDTTQPIISVLGKNPIRIEQGSVYTDDGAKAKDDEDGIVEVVIDNPVNTQVPGKYLITYTAADKKGNQTTAQRSVQVVRAQSFRLYDGVWQGKCKPSTRITSAVSIQHQIKLDATQRVDTIKAHNTSDCSDDATFEIELFTDLTYLGEHLTGMCQGEKVDIAINFITRDGRALSESEKATFATDFNYPLHNIFCLDNDVLYLGDTTGSNNGSTEDRRPIEFDTRALSGFIAFNDTAPVITLNGDKTITIDVDSTYVDPGATAKDDIDGEIEVTTSGSVDTLKVGVYTITYEAVDSSGNKTTATRTVTVKEVVVKNQNISGTWKNNCEANTNELLKSRGVVATSSTLFITEGRLTSEVTGFNNNNCLGGVIYEGTAIASLSIADSMAQPDSFCVAGEADQVDLIVTTAVLNGSVLSDKALLTFITLSKLPTHNLICIDPSGQLRTGDTSNGFDGTTPALRPVLMDMTGSGYSRMSSN